MPIRVLPIHLVNKIAAGEVIERPASIVKELVENSLDAGATRIDVAIEDGGRKLISVSDNGGGMDEGDLALAFVPHATSKLAAEDDLFAIGTMGFRGEALASISSVSHAHIRTRRREGSDASGYEIEASGETTGTVRPCAAAVGTTVTIRDLFFNTPARRKFMKTAGTELSHITEQMSRLALPHPQVAFTLTHNGRSVQNLPAVASTAARTADLFGPEICQTLMPVVHRQAPIHIAGLISSPAGARATGKWQYFFLNGRHIRDRLLGHALKESYRGLMDSSRWPAAFLFIEIDPAEVDVNVHPTKVEVRFRDSQAVHGELLASLRETLNRANLTPAAHIEGDYQPAAPAGEGESGDDRRQSLRAAMADFFKSVPPLQPRLSFPEPAPLRVSPDATLDPLPDLGTMPKHRAVCDAPACSLQSVSDAVQPWDSPTQTTLEGGADLPAASPAASPIAAPPRALPARAMQIHNSYILAACEDGLLIVDQHALHERLMYNDLKRRLAGGALTGQRLLIPPTLAVTAAQADLLAERAQLLASLGIEVAAFGPGTVAIQQFPMLLIERKVQPATFVRELLDQLAEDATTDSERLLQEMLAMMACKAAVKAGDPLSPSEIDDLLARREAAEKGSACPHGRPSSLKLTLKDLEKQFKRT